MSAETAAATAPLVLASTQAGITTLTLNRPERFNPLSLAMMAALQERLDASPRTIRFASSSSPQTAEDSAPATISRRCARTRAMRPGSAGSSTTAAG